MQLLQKEAELQEIVQLVGSDALPEEQKLTLEVARMVREVFLQQNAYHPVDTYSPLSRQYKYMKVIKNFSDLAAEGGRVRYQRRGDIQHAGAIQAAEGQAGHQRGAGPRCHPGRPRQGVRGTGGEVNDHQGVQDNHSDRWTAGLRGEDRTHRFQRDRHRPPAGRYREEGPGVGHLRRCRGHPGVRRHLRHREGLWGPIPRGDHEDARVQGHAGPHPFRFR